MSVRRRLTSAAMLVALLVAPHGTAVAGVDEAQRNVDAVLSELEGLRDQLGQLDVDYGEATARRDELERSISAAQVRLDALTAELGGVQDVLTGVAVERFVSGGGMTLSPIFSDAGTYTAEEQKAAFGLVTIDAGNTDMDSLQALADQVYDEQSAMRRMQDESAQLMQTIESKKAEYEQLEQVYTTKYAQAKTALGEAQFKAEQERRAAAASAARARVTTPTPRSAPRGGGSSGGSGGTVTYPSPSGRAGIAVRAALSQVGVPYRFAASEPGVAFDCSGLTGWAWEQAGVSLPHQSQRQYNVTAHVPVEQAQPGDLIFYYSPIGHVGLYIGSGQMVHAPEPGQTVSVTTVRWNKVVGVGRPG